MECGKTFKNTALANYHAEKSGHDQFEESMEEVSIDPDNQRAFAAASGIHTDQTSDRRRKEAEA